MKRALRSTPTIGRRRRAGRALGCVGVFDAAKAKTMARAPDFGPSQVFYSPRRIPVRSPSSRCSIFLSEGRVGGGLSQGRSPEGTVLVRDTLLSSPIVGRIGFRHRASEARRWRRALRARPCVEADRLAGLTVLGFSGSTRHFPHIERDVLKADYHVVRQASRLHAFAHLSSTTPRLVAGGSPGREDPRRSASTG